jgi:hypothetical protein
LENDEKVASKSNKKKLSVLTLESGMSLLVAISQSVHSLAAACLTSLAITPGNKGK